MASRRAPATGAFVVSSWGSTAACRDEGWTGAAGPGIVRPLGATQGKIMCLLSMQRKAALTMTPIENITMVQQRDTADAARRWGFVCAMA